MQAPVPQSPTQVRRPDPAHGVFETMLVVDGHPVDLDAHLARLKTSLAELFPGHEPPPLAKQDVPGIRGRYGYSTPGTSPLSSLRVTVAPSGDGRLEARSELRAAPPGAFMSLDGNAPSTPISLHTLQLPGGLGAHKWADRSLLEEAQAGLLDDGMPLVVDTDGAALEASRANLFAVRNGALFTPPLDGRILPGVTRARVLEIAAAVGLETHEDPLSGDDLHGASEVFLTGSVRGIERVRSLDGAALMPGGEIGSRIEAELHHAWTGAAQVG